MIAHKVAYGVRSGNYVAIIAYRCALWLVPCTQPWSRATTNLSPRRDKLTFSRAARMSSKPIRSAGSCLRSDGQPLSSPARNAAGESKSSDAEVESIVRDLVQSTAAAVLALFLGAILDRRSD